MSTTIKSFTKRPIQKGPGRVSAKDIAQMVEEFDLNDDARLKLESTTPEVFDIVRTDFRTPMGCTNSSGMLISFVAAVSKRLRSTQYPVFQGRKVSDSTSFRPETARARGNDRGIGRPSHAILNASSFMRSWGLPSMCQTQLAELSHEHRNFALKYFRPDDTDDIHSCFQEFIRDLSQLPPCMYEVQDTENASNDLEAFCATYNLNEDARAKLQSISLRSLETVMREFKYPEGSPECNGMIINFANGVEKNIRRRRR